MITIFRNIKDTDQPFYKDINYILHRIRDGASKDLIKKIRSEKDKTRRNELKQALPAICFSGKFSRRSDSALVEHSGFIGLDFDGYERQKDMLQDKEQMKKNKFVYSVFVSPSGNGFGINADSVSFVPSPFFSSSMLFSAGIFSMVASTLLEDFSIIVTMSGVMVTLMPDFSTP